MADDARLLLARRSSASGAPQTGLQNPLAGAYVEGMISGVSVYQLHLNKPDMKTLPEEEAPLP